MSAPVDRDAEHRAAYVAQLRRAADLIEQYELPIAWEVDINAPISAESDDEKDAILVATAERIGMPVDRSKPTQPCIKLKLGDRGIYHIYYGTEARRAAFNEAHKRMDGWDKGLDDPAEPEPVPTAVEDGAAKPESGPQLASAWQNEDGTIGSECRCGVTFDGFERKDRAVLDDLFAKHECNTLPPKCAWIGGCTWPAEPDEHQLCALHRAEVFPELVGGGRDE